MMRAGLRRRSFLLSLAPLPMAAAAAPLSEEIAQRAGQLLQDRAAVGIVAAVYRQGETQVWGFGETARGSGRMPDGDTVFEIGSISKTFTSVLLAGRVGQGAMDEQAPVQQFLPASVRMPVAEGQAVTLRHLATHTSGLPRRPDNLPSRDRLDPYAGYTAEALYAFLQGHSLRRAPGQFEYSNLGFGLLGHALSLHAGLGYDQMVQERICRPLGMADTAVSLAPQARQRLARPYDAQLREVRNWDLAVLAGAGGLKSTANDLLKYIAAHAARQEGELGRALRLTHGRRFTHGDGKGQGLGWRLSRDDRILFHGGSTGGYRAWLAVVPSRGLGVVVLANSADPRIYGLGDQLIHLLMGLPPPSPREAAEPE